MGFRLALHIRSRCQLAHQTVRQYSLRPAWAQLEVGHERRGNDATDTRHTRSYAVQAPAFDPETISVYNPATGELIATIQAPLSSKVTETIQCAHEAFKSGVWSKLPSLSRSKVLANLARALERRVPELAALESLQTGRTIREMKAQLSRLPEWFDYFAALIRVNNWGFVTPTQGKLLNYVHRVPLGVVAQITPFNHPLLIAVKKIAPALAAGNSVIVKPSELAPLSVLELVKMAESVGVPEGVLSILVGGTSTATDIVRSPLIRKVDLTAGTNAGRAVGKIVGANLASYTAELGGKAPIIVLGDADLAAAVNGVAFASFVASGQTCVSGTRILVEDTIYDEFLSRFLKKVEGIRERMGDPSNPRSTMGTVISLRHLQRIEDMIGRVQGDIVVGGKRMFGKSAIDGFDFSRGCFFPPTVITNLATLKQEIWQEEVFGPIVVVQRFADEADAIILANDCRYGLGAGVWTQDLSRAHRVASHVEAGLCWVNTHHRNDPSSPWGGMKDSGFGRENGVEAFESYSQSKSIIVNIASAEESRTADDWFGEVGEGRRYG